ncbi:MAG: sugar phosphate isomerase/epimerase [Anaerotruncus sp.]|nr:sugar phosphate isomerase/epimerase [Anaerotruncus sp.]
MTDFCLAANVTTPEVQIVPGMLAYTGDLKQSFSVLHCAGYTGVEWITVDPDRLGLPILDQLLAEYQLHPVAVNTGRLCGELGLTLSSPKQEIRMAAEQRMKKVMEFAAHWGVPVNVGILRGCFLPEVSTETTYGWTVEALQRLSSFGTQYGVTLLLETVTTKMTNFINTLSQAAQLIRDVNQPALGVMYDVFQMDLEEPDMQESIQRYCALCGHVHLADRDRKVPGDGGLDFPAILKQIVQSGYTGAYSIELEMQPNPEIVHQRAAAYLKLLFESL